MQRPNGYAGVVEPVGCVNDTERGLDSPQRDPRGRRASAGALTANMITFQHKSV